MSIRLRDVSIRFPQMRNTIKRITKLIAVSIGLYCTLNLLVGFNQSLLNRSVEHQILHISSQLLNAADQQLQQQYPEGNVFANAIFALSLIEYSEKNPQLNPDHATLVDQCIMMLLSGETQQHFDNNLHLQYGAFYHGWTNYVLYEYQKSSLFISSSYRESINTAYRQFSDRIVESQEDSVRLLETYHSSYWPADNLMCIASLDSNYQSLKLAWTNHILDSSENEHDLVNHDGFQPTVSRGSSLALSIYALAQIDPTLAANQYEVFDEEFNLNILGIHFIKEHHDQGEMDIDSGPIIFGIGSVATIMNIKAIENVNNEKLKLTWGLLNLLGIPLHWSGHKSYLFEKELMFDIFMLWMSMSLLEEVED